MSGNKRLISGKIAQSKVRGQALVKALGALVDEQNEGANPSKITSKKK